MGASRETERGEAAGIACGGPCSECGVVHSLPEGDARAHGRRLMREFREIARLDYRVPAGAADPALSFDRLFPGGHGNMFGVLECEDADGRTVVLRAFSSLKRGIRDVAGWVPPILPADTYYGTIVPTQQKIEELTVQLERAEPHSEVRRELLARRKRISRALLDEMQELYRFHNFRGEVRSLHDACFTGTSERAASLPGGVGECCAPKLLDRAAVLGLRPRGIAEFYWGDSDTKRAGAFYPSCEARCRPILGFMLCGLEDGV